MLVSCFLTKFEVATAATEVIFCDMTLHSVSEIA